MSVISDSYMGMFLPEDILHRITKFMDGSLDFPFIAEHEIMGVFYLFGKNNGIGGQIEVMTVTDLVRKTIAQLGRDIRVFYNTPNKMDSGFIREDYTKRALQISIESRNDPYFDPADLNRRIAGDPTILSNCFAQHISYYKQNYFFELFQPFKDNQVPSFARKSLSNRMLLLGFNKTDAKSLPFKNTLEPFIKWLRKSN